MNESLLRIYKKFDGKLVGKEKLKIFVCKSVLLLPARTQAYVTRSCWFIGSMEDAWAFTFTGNDIKNQHLIFLSDDLLEQDDSQILYSILHEIGHVVLRHRNSVLGSQSSEEIQKQEHDADLFARNYLP
jgi:Zn-dependent protease with chaperone function